jgi:undecaprenyl-diphosphatase
MDFAQVIMLASIQGLTELLPVSSSAHVILAERLMGLDPTLPATTFLLVMLHAGTMLAVLVYFGPRWWRRWRSTRRPGSTPAGFLAMTVVATACTGVLGLALKVFIERVLLGRILGQPRAEVEQLFGNLPLIAAALLSVGVLIIMAGGRQTSGRASGLTVRSAVVIGTVQALALPLRGFSRSGATISTALLLGTERELAEDFSFALAVWLTPPVIALELHRLLRATGFHDLTAELVAERIWPGFVGMGVSFLAGLMALRWLSAWLEGGRWRLFGYYCLAFAVLVWVGHRFGL